MKIKAFASRNAKEILRDPLSYIFCLGFPVVMLVIMTIVNESIPPEAGMDIFNIDKLSPGVTVFGLTFIMLFTTILISKDRSTAFLARLCGAPMKSWEFLAGYILPVFVIALLQGLITYAASWVISLIKGEPLDILSMLISLGALVPAIVLFISLGVVFGSLFSERAAPGVSSILITVSSILGGIWMDIEAVGGALKAVAQALPFFPAVDAARIIVSQGGRQLASGEVAAQEMICIAYMAVFFILGAFILKKKMKA